MSRFAQAFDSLPASVFVSASLKAGMLIGILALGGCGSGGFSLEQADIETLAGKDVPWANPETGSRGAIMQLAENKAGGQLCRHFTATRESFDGVALFKGETCMVGYGAWRMQAFTAQ